jgi:hypothetical protein
MQGGLPHAALQVAHVAEATSSRVSASARRFASQALLIVSCNVTLALASIGGGGGIIEWLSPLRTSCRDVLSHISTSTGPSASTSIAVACARSGIVEGSAVSFNFTGKSPGAPNAIEPGLVYVVKVVDFYLRRQFSV